ncbi:MAG: ADP-ribosyl-[dinitrogen reductase] hydrolase [Magnetococcales bacterium]|nr:ADP-ribosyl-[dinitrogen reductase] hydrolase [Magnetococcales bacterium]
MFVDHHPVPHASIFAPVLKHHHRENTGLLWPWKKSELQPENDVERRALGAYLGLAVGDALGATVEFMMPNEIQARHGVHNTLCGGGWLRLKPGQVTDDTAMALVLGEAILAHNGQVIPHVVAEAFDQWMRSKPVDIGDTVRRGIVQFRLHQTTEMPLDDWGGGNGACMRTLPIALITYGREDADMVAASRIQAHITHHNHHSDAGTECINRMVQLALAGKDIPEIVGGPVQTLIQTYPDFRFRRKRPLSNPSGYIVDTLRTVFEGFFGTDHFEDCLVNVVNRGGDADTTGAIAGMIAGAYYGPEGIPSRWLKRLDPTIHQACRSQALSLIRMAVAHLAE